MNTKVNKEKSGGYTYFAKGLLGRDFDLPFKVHRAITKRWGEKSILACCAFIGTFFVSIVLWIGRLIGTLLGAIPFALYMCCRTNRSTTLSKRGSAIEAIAPVPTRPPAPIEPVRPSVEAIRSLVLTDTAPSLSVPIGKSLLGKKLAENRRLLRLHCRYGREAMRHVRSLGIISSNNCGDYLVQREHLTPSTPAFAARVREIHSEVERMREECDSYLHRPSSLATKPTWVTAEIEREKDIVLRAIKSEIASTLMHKRGNCHELALLGFEHIRRSHPEVPLSIHAIMRYSGAMREVLEATHVFLVIGKGSSAVVCDIWAEEIFADRHRISVLKNYADKLDLCQGKPIPVATRGFSYLSGEWSAHPSYDPILDKESTIYLWDGRDLQSSGVECPKWRPTAF